MHPNIIFILVDDLGWKDLSCYGSEFYETPHLDRLAQASMCFWDAYAACPVCSPTRASLLTGKYPATVGITDWIDHTSSYHPLRGRLIEVPYLKQLPRSEHTLAAALHDAGYATWHVGKWHLGGAGSAPQDHGFEVNVGGCEMGSPGAGGFFSPWTISALQNVAVPAGTYLTDYLTDQAITLIQDQDERLFFLNMWYYSVHTPIEAPTEKIEKYTAKARALGLDQIDPFEEGEIFPTEDKKHRRVCRRRVQSDPVYAAMIESLDENIGRLLQTLEDTGRADNTIVIFTSDNGGLATAESSPTCNAPLAEGKGWMYEGGTRVPLFIAWPGHITPQTHCDVPITSTDLYPTLLALAGLDPQPEQHRDGVSLIPLLHGAEHLERDAIFWHYPHYGNQGGTPGAAVRMGDYKLIKFFEDERIELYNLRTDIEEKHNLAPEKPALSARMMTQLAAWQAAIEAQIPLPNPDWKSD